MSFLRRVSCVMILFALCIALATPAMAQFPFFDNPLVGKSAPDFRLKTLSGQERSLSEALGNKDGIILFWATWCPHCRRAVNELNRRVEEFEKKGTRVVLVDLGEDARTVGEYVQRNQIKFDVFLDVEGNLSDDYRIIGVPTFVFVDPQGKVKDVGHELPRN